MSMGYQPVRNLLVGHKLSKSQKMPVNWLMSNLTLMQLVIRTSTSRFILFYDWTNLFNSYGEWRKQTNDQQCRGMVLDLCTLIMKCHLQDN